MLYFQAFFTELELITILKAITPLIKDVQQLILDKIADDIINEEIRNISNIYLYEGDDYLDDYLDIEDYYSYY